MRPDPVVSRVRIPVRDRAVDSHSCRVEDKCAVIPRRAVAVDIAIDERRIRGPRQTCTMAVSSMSGVMG